MVSLKLAWSSTATVLPKLNNPSFPQFLGITSDPLTQFAVVMSALIHDVDHTGVPNSQLVKENARVAAYYKNKSVAEQNSVDMSWSLLMEPQFRSLRQTIYCDEAELTRFRSLLVNAVMATDIVSGDSSSLLCHTGCINSCLTKYSCCLFYRWIRN